MRTSPSDEAEEPQVVELRRIGAAVLEVVRRLVVFEKARGEVPMLPPVRLPSLDAGTRLGQIAALALSDASAAVFAILVVGELQRDVHRALTRLGGEAGVGIAVEALVTVAGQVGTSELTALGALAPSGPLARRGLIAWIDDEGPTLTRRVTVPDRVLRHIVEDLDEAADDLPLRREPVRPLAEIFLGAGEPSPVEQLRLLLPKIEQQPVWIAGLPGSGRRTLLASLASELGLATLCIDHRSIARMPPSELAPRLWREVLLEQALVCIHDVQTSNDGAAPADLYAALAAAGLPVAFTSTAVPALGEFEDPPSVVELTPPCEIDRLALWKAALPGCEGIAALTSRFRLTPGRVQRVAASARATAELAGRVVDEADVRRAVSRAVGQRVATLGTRVNDAQTWDDVVLPEDTHEAVREMISRVRSSHQVLEEWGFQRKLAKGTGVVALFAGPPGTGKTMVAGLVARELGLDLYQIDLSRMVSKWVGETEKNLAQVFDAAEGANVMLLFDEADSLFGKRTEVNSAHDRHSNAEVNYLLQRVERFDGVCVLTTNLEGSIDSAFRRRLAFRIHFPMPSVSERTGLWQRMIPSEAAVEGQVDFDYLAAEFEMSGGRIRNAVLRAAFLAAGEHSAITMSHLERAVVLEYRDAGALAPTGRLA